LFLFACCSVNIRIGNSRATTTLNSLQKNMYTGNFPHQSLLMYKEKATAIFLFKSAILSTLLLLLRENMIK
jgi:hypothetical protein